MSRGSGHSTRKHRRHRSRNRDSGSERGGSTIDYNHNETLVDSGKQWLEVQKKQAEISNTGTVQQAAVVKSNTAPKFTNSTDTYNRNKRSRKHRYTKLLIFHSYYLEHKLILNYIETDLHRMEAVKFGLQNSQSIYSLI